MNKMVSIYLHKLFRAILGNTLMGAGIALIISADLGVDPWTVLTLGTSHTFQLTPGRAAQVQGLFIMAGVLLLYRRRPGIGTLLNLFLVGYFIDRFSGLWPAPQTLVGQIGVLCSAILVIGVGVAIYVSARLGEGPIEQLMISLRERHNWRISRIRVVMDAFATTIGFVLGGAVGLGTLIAVISIGPVVEKTLCLIPPLDFPKM